MNMEYTLEMANVFYTGEVEQGTCCQKLFDNVKTGVILKDVSMEVHSGEVLAILGSKGSGKRALLEVISRRAQGPTRGQILLNGAAMSLILFQHNCGYVTHKCDLISSLTVMQTLTYASNLTIGSKVTNYMKRTRVKQVLADLALTQVSNRRVHQLTDSEHRRLMIGIQLVRDPVLLLLDEPTWDLDPLNTYLIVSILSNHAKKYNRIVLLTMEKPRSDVFPFLDRVTYLCLGDVVYTGATQFMLDYFRSIGFPCPELENPLMYYLCLSTVDRRSRERFIESNHQIAALVEKFKLEGGSFRKASSGSQIEPPVDPMLTGAQHKLPLSAFGHPGIFQVAAALYKRNFAASFNISSHGLKELFLRLLFLPLMFALLYAIYFNMGRTQSVFVSRNGFIFNMMCATYFVSIISTIHTFKQHRTRYYQEAHEGLYSGPLFYIVQTIYSLPFSFLTCCPASIIALQVIGESNVTAWLKLSGVLWSCYLLAEHQTMAIMMVVYSKLTAGITSCVLTIFTLVLGSGNLRSYNGLSEWLLYITYATQTRYAGMYMNYQYMYQDNSLNQLPYSSSENCSVFNISEQNLLCRYASGKKFLSQKYGDNMINDISNHSFNLLICFVFSILIIILNTLLYLIPLPRFVKDKFRM